MGLACMAKPQSPGTVRVQGGGQRLSCYGQAVWGNPSGWNRGPKLWVAGGQTGREPLVWTDLMEQMELQPWDRFPLLDHAKCFQAWGLGRRAALEVNSRGSSSSSQLCDLGLVSLPP